MFTAENYVHLHAFGEETCRPLQAPQETCTSKVKVCYLFCVCVVVDFAIYGENPTVDARSVPSSRCVDVCDGCIWLRHGLTQMEGGDGRGAFSQLMDAGRTGEGDPSH